MLSQVLTEDQILRIHNASLAILQRTGVGVPHDGMLDMMEQAGARVDRGAKRAFIPEELVMRSVEQAGKQFTPEQLRWLEMIRDHIATSLSFDPEIDFDVEPFRQEGSIDGAYEVFGSELNSIIEELNGKLAVV